MLINITDNFEARQIYFKAIFYSKDIGRNESEFVNYFADKINHSWEECTIKIEENKMRLRLYTPHDEKMNKQFGKETLEIEFFGDEEAKNHSKKKLEGMTGIKIK